MIFSNLTTAGSRQRHQDLIAILNARLAFNMAFSINTQIQNFLKNNKLVKDVCVFVTRRRDQKKKK